MALTMPRLIITFLPIAAKFCAIHRQFCVAGLAVPEERRFVGPFNGYFCVRKAFLYFCKAMASMATSVKIENLLST
jgi:hypothetical protein